MNVYFSIVDAKQEEKYHHIKKYDNGFEVIYFYNPQFKNTSVALQVNVGRYDDPKNYRGITHLIEHSFNHAGYFSNFNTTALEKGSIFNAQTNASTTLYKITNIKGDPKYVFKQINFFLTNPKFLHENIVQDIKIIASERELITQNPGSIFVNALREHVVEEHPFHHYIDDDLGKYLNSNEIINKLYEFHKNNYEPRRTSLIISSYLPIRKLEKQVNRLLKDFINAESSRSNIVSGYDDLFSSIVFNDQYINLAMDSLREDQSLIFLFPLAPFENRVSHLASAYFTFQLNRKDPDSLYQVLLKNKIAIDLLADKMTIDGKNSFLMVEIKMNQERFQNRKLIEKILLSYLKEISSQPSTLNMLSILDTAKLNSLVVESNSNNMMDYLIDNFELYSNQNDVELDRLLHAFDKDKFLMTQNIIRNAFLENGNAKFIKFSVNFDENKKVPSPQFQESSFKMIDGAKSQSFDQLKLDGSLNDGRKIFSFETVYKSASVLPELCSDKNGIRVWTKNYEDLEHKIFLGVHIEPASMKESDSKERYILNNLLKILLEQDLGHLIENFKLIGNDVKIEVTGLGDLSISVSSDYSNILLLSQEIASFFNNLNTRSESGENFSLLKLILENKRRELNYDILAYDNYEVIRTAIRNYSLHNLTLADIDKVSSGKFNRYLQSLVFNGVDLYFGHEKIKDDITQLTDILSNAFINRLNSVVSDTKMSQESLWYDLPSKTTEKRLDLPNIGVNWCFVNYQFFDFNDQTRAKAYIIRTFLKNRFFEFVRSQTSPDYLVNISTIENGMQFSIYSKDKSVQELAEIIDQFILSEKKNLSWINSWRAKREYLKRSKWIETLSFEELNKYYWHDIIYPEFGINDRMRIIDEVKRTDFRLLGQFYDELLIDDLTKRKLIVSS